MLGWLLVDVLGAALLGATGLLGLRTWRGGGPAARGSRYWLFAGGGLLLLAADERLSLHERTGELLWRAGLPLPPAVNHHDDLVLLAVAAAGLGLTLGYLRELVRWRAARPAFALGGLLAAVALGIDALGPLDGWAPRVEESLELAAQVSFLVAFARCQAPPGRLPAAAPVAGPRQAEG